MTYHCRIVSRLFASIMVTASEEVSVLARSIEIETDLTQAKAFLKEIHMNLKQISQTIFTIVEVWLQHGCK